jgi:hypothetical protein
MVVPLPLYTEVFAGMVREKLMLVICFFKRDACEIITSSVVQLLNWLTSIPKNIVDLMKRYFYLL